MLGDRKGITPVQNLAPAIIKVLLFLLSETFGIDALTWHHLWQNRPRTR